MPGPAPPPASRERPVDDPPLVAAAQAGDKAAFEALYRRHVGPIHALCRRLADDAASAEELTQEAFVLAWRKLASFRGDSAFGSWLYRLTVNHALSARRGRRLEAGRVLSYDAGPPGASDRDHESTANHGSDGFAAVAPTNPSLAIDLERAIAGLPDGARNVFVLADVYGHAHEEIGRLLGIAPGTSKAQLHRARMLLRKALDR